MTTNLAFQRWLFVLVVLTGAFCSIVHAKAADDGTELVTRVYPVADLIFTPPDYPFKGISTDVSFPPPPPFGGGAPTPGGIGGGGGFGGGGGLGGGGFGGGGFGGAQSDGGQQGGFITGVTTDATSIEQLTKVIQSTIATQTWDRVGGPGTMTGYGSRLIISQTRDVHTKIKELLTSLRASGTVQTTITVRAWWLRLDAAQYQKLLADMPATSPPLVNRKQLEALAAEKSADIGEVTCFDGQTVHIISGRFRNAVIGVTPVVGQLDLEQQPNSEIQLAALETPATKLIVREAVHRREQSQQPPIQLAAQVAEGEVEMPAAGFVVGGGFGGGGVGGTVGQGWVGYQPQSAKQHAGALLELTPTRLQEANAVVLDLKSKVSQWKEQPEGLEFNRVVRLDQTSVVSQQLATTLKVPLGKPVLVGGLSLQPGATDEDVQGQLYLVVEAITADKGN